MDEDISLVLTVLFAIYAEVEKNYWLSMVWGGFAVLFALAYVAQWLLHLLM